MEETAEGRLQTKLEVHRNRQLMQKIEYLNSQIDELVQEKKSGARNNTIDDFVTTDRDNLKLKLDEILKENTIKIEKIQQLSQELENTQIEKKEIHQKSLKISKELNDSKIEINILQSTC